MTNEAFAHIAHTIPKEPGVYRYYDKEHKLIYVGKAKHLRKRVSSYFSKQHENHKTRELVRRIDRIEFTIVNSEQDAFLLENSLIKEYQPLFNINLKDDKTYPYIVVRNEPFPRMYFTRRKLNDGSQYFGPYTSVAKVRELLEFIRQNIPLRNCTLNLHENNIKKNKFKVCLEYHLGNCKGPCEGLQTAEDYDEGINRIRHMLKGNLKPVLLELRRLVKHHSDNLEFEKAAQYQEKIRHLNEYQSSSTIVNSWIGTVDVFSIIEDGDTAFVHYISVSHGTIIHTKTITLEKQLDESKEEMLIFAIGQLMDMFKSDAKEMILPFELTYPDDQIHIVVPKSGDKKKLLDLCEKNAQYFKSARDNKKMLRLEDKTAEEHLSVLENLQDDLHLTSLPVHIECFDNSNFHGTNAVAAMVCFRDGEPSKKDYRHFNIKMVSGINDFASMQEVVFRRYKRLKEDKLPLPQLVIIDGGKGQLNAALQSIRELGLEGRMTLVGLAKNQEELFFEGDSASIQLAWNGESLKLIRCIRDEVHRFGITHHRKKRSIAALENELEKIPGIGKATFNQLMQRYKSMKTIRSLTVEELEKHVGRKRAQIIFDSLNAKKKGQDRNPAPL